MPTYTNYNNYIKAKANSAVCCTSAGHCVGGGTSGSGSGSVITNYDGLQGDHNISVNNFGSSATIGLKADIFAHTLTLSNETLIFKDASGQSLSLGYKAPLNSSYKLHFPNKNPKDLSYNDFSYAMFVNADGQLSWGEFVTRIFDLGDFSLNSGSNITFDISYDISRIIINLDDTISLSSIDVSKSLTLTDASLVFKKASETITITAPENIDKSYNLTLPKTKADVSGSVLKVDSSGQLYFSNLLDLSLGEYSNLDLSHNGTDYILKLYQDISITSLDVSSAITLKSSTSGNNNRITLKGPKEDPSYILTFPDTLGTISGGFLQSTLSGDLYFSNGWLNNISGDHNIDISIIKTPANPYTKISLNPDISVSTIDVSSSINLIDASLVFHAKDSRAITIVAPHVVSKEYTLTLPISHNPDQSGNFLRVDGFGQLYFDGSLNDLSGGKNIDISYGKDYNIISLKEDISLTNIELSGNLTFSIGDNSNVTIGIPQDVSSYSLKLPFSHSPDQSGNFLRVDGSGQLYFADASLNDLSGSTNIDISYGTNYNFIKLKKDIKDISSIALDSSLVFQVSDTSSITIIPPTDISENYKLTLPKHLKAGLLRSDVSGNLKFVDSSLNDISGSTNIDISYGTQYNFVKLRKDIKDISSIALDSSLVFQLSDGSAITIVAPPDASGYTLKLPKNYKEVTESSGQFLRVDGSGQLYFADASLDIISIKPGDSNLTISSEKIGDINTFTIDLCSNLDLSSISLDNDLTFKNDGKIIFEGIQADSSGAYMRVDGSGNLYFEDISLHDISLVSNSINLTIDVSLIDPKTKQFKLDLSSNLILEKLTISNELIVAEDASLVFRINDNSNIKIVAPHDVSNSYTLTLPTALSEGGLIDISTSGHLTIKHPDHIKFTAPPSKPTIKDLISSTSLSTFTIHELIKKIDDTSNRHLIKEGLPITYYLPLMTFNSDRESTIDQSFSYFDYDKDEFTLMKSSINYINERNLLHAINFNCKYMLNYASVQSILTNYIDAINGFIELPLINIMANDFYLKVLNVACIAKKYIGTHSDYQNNDYFYKNNKNLINFLTYLNKIKSIYHAQFNETACIIPSNLNPPYYFDTSGGDSIKIKYDNSLNVNGIDISLNPLLIFGDIEYEQNFVAIKNALDNNNIHKNNDNGKNIIFYFYSQNVGPKQNYEFDFLFADSSYNYTDLDICATPVLKWKQGNFFSSNNAFSIKNITLDSNNISDASCALFVNPNNIHLWDGNSQITNPINFNNSQGPNEFDIYNPYKDIRDNDDHDDLRLYFLVEHKGSTYKVLRGTSDTSGWVYEGSQNGKNGIHISDLTSFNGNTDISGTFTINIQNLANNSIFSQTKDNPNNYSMNTFINDNSNTCFYDYGNIMFALDASLSNDLSLNNGLDKILIPPINDLNSIYELMDEKSVYINYDTSINLDSLDYNNNNIDFSFNASASASLITSKIYNEETRQFTNDNYNLLKDASFSNSLEFIDCASGNHLVTISFERLEDDLSNNNDTSNILIVCPLYQQNYLIDADTNSNNLFMNIHFQVDNQFSKSLYRYYPLIQYFNTLSKKHPDTCYNFTYIVSTNQTNTVNDLVYSGNSGTTFGSIINDGDTTADMKDYNHIGAFTLDFSQNIFISDKNNSKIITTYYDKLNKVYKTDGKLLNDKFISIAPQNINSYINKSSNLIEKIILHNYNSLENPNTSLLEDLGETSILTNYNSIDSIINSYMLYLLYESSTEISNNLVNVIKQKNSSNSNKDFKLYEYYTKMQTKIYDNDNDNDNDHNNSSDISLIRQIINGNIKLTENGLNKLLTDLNFSFYELTDEDFNNKSHFSSIKKNYNIGNFRLTMPLIHYNDNSNNNNNFTEFNPHHTNSTLLSYNIHISDYFSGSNILISDISNNDLTNKYCLTAQERYKILHKWTNIYKDYSQYLTL